MTLTPGTRIGPHEIVALLGSGGMGEVYKARDTRLNRTVAIKVLSTPVASDPTLRARFEREARAIAALSHPHICTIYDVGRHEKIDYLVMEYLEGETLEARLMRSKGPLPLEEALRIAIEIADALAAAHRQGIVHRDLKPANVMLARLPGPIGAPCVKLLDFGLAKTAAPAVGVIGTSGMLTSPTQAITAQGTILGTFQYMAPEQVEGADADARSDIFAFGCVLYELVTGKKAFEGKTQASLIAAILEREPQPIAALQPLAPSLLDSIVRRCLAKRPDDRWQSAADLSSALRWLKDGNTGTVIPRPDDRRRRRIAIMAASLATALAILALSAIRSRLMPAPVESSPIVRFEVLPPPNVTLTPAPVAAAAQLALSPDGRRLVFVGAAPREASRLWIRPLDSLQAQPVADTEGASFPFWSPDGRFIAFFAGGKLKKVDTIGGRPQPIADSVTGRGGTWSADGVIVFGAGSYTALSQVPAAGGIVKPATTLAATKGALADYWPQFLSDGRHFLYYQRNANLLRQGVYIGSLDSDETTMVLASGSRALSSRGHIFVVREGMLFSQAFDERTFKVHEEPTRVGDGVGYFESTFGYTALTVSASGAIAYGPTVAPLTSLRWRDSSGSSNGAPVANGVSNGPRMSPDQKIVAMSVRQAGSSTADIWVVDLIRGVSSRSTFDAANEWFPAWSRNGARLFFASTRRGVSNIYQKIGVAKEEPLVDDTGLGGAVYPCDTSADGKTLLLMQSSPGGYDLASLALSQNHAITPLVSSRFNEVQGRFSPNAHWVAYASDESGKFEVYVRPFPVSDGQWRISTDGGLQPEWRDDGKALFYISGDGKLMEVPVMTDSALFNAGTPHALFDADIPEASPPYPGHYAVAADGRRFLINTLAQQPARQALTVVLNWISSVEK